MKDTAKSQRAKSQQDAGNQAEVLFLCVAWHDGWEPSYTVAMLDEETTISILVVDESAEKMQELCVRNGNAPIMLCLKKE